MKERRIYLAGPLFTAAEIDFNKKLAKELEASGHSVFLPQEMCKGKDSSDIFVTCKNGVKYADIIVAILDGADADSGTCWECGYAYGLDKIVIGIRTDFRQSGDRDGFNTMLYYSCYEVIKGDKELVLLLNDIIESI